MRSLSIAFTEYASDNDGQLPGRVTGVGDKWPVLLLPYISDPRAYVDPGDPIASTVPPQNLASNNGNASSFFFNGFNDLGAYDNPGVTVTLANIASASNLAIVGQKVNGSTQYYMDFEEGNENDVLNKTAYFQGANYAFADGSARYHQAGRLPEPDLAGEPELHDSRSSMGTTPRLVLVTVPNLEEARRIAEAVLKSSARRLREHRAGRRVALLVARQAREGKRASPAREDLGGTFRSGRRRRESGPFL